MLGRYKWNSSVHLKEKKCCQFYSQGESPQHLYSSPPGCGRREWCLELSLLDSERGLIQTIPERHPLIFLIDKEQQQTGEQWKLFPIAECPSHTYLEDNKSTFTQEIVSSQTVLPSFPHHLSFLIVRERVAEAAGEGGLFLCTLPLPHNTHTHTHPRSSFRYWCSLVVVENVLFCFPPQLMWED